jgi:hypothetical protein
MDQGAGGAAGMAGAPGVIAPELSLTSAAPDSGRRLTKTEYLYTVEDILGVRTDELEAVIVADSGGEGFRNTFAALLPSAKRTEAFSTAATLVAQQLTPATVAAYSAGCTDFSPACTTQFVNTVGRLLFRRPLMTHEAAIYSGLFVPVQQNNDSFDFGARFVIEAMLQSPNFLYRLERADRALGDKRQVDGYELATRLSYLLWHSAPDAALLDGVEAGVLSPMSVKATVEGMIASPKFSRSVRQFTSEWLQLYLLENRVRDEALYPEFSPELVADMQEETLAFFESLVLTDRASFMTAYTAPQTPVSERLAALYGLPAAAPRVGFLTQASVLTAHSLADSTSIVDRGIFVLSKLLCRPVPAPPEALRDKISETKKNVDQSQVQRSVLEQHRADPLCANCHAMFDPLGYAFEAYDGIGRFQVADPKGNPIATHGEASVDGTTRPYANAVDFANIMAGSSWAKDCVVKQLTEFAYGRVLNSNDEPLLASLGASFEASGQDLTDLFLQVALSAPLQQYVSADQSQTTSTFEETETQP